MNETLGEKILRKIRQNKNCFWCKSFRYIKHQDVLDGECRLNPPVINKLDDCTDNDYPLIMSEDDWCSHFSPLLTDDKMLCVFHEEKTPSLSLDFENEKYHCFSCRKDGDLFEVICELHGIPYSTQEQLENEK